MRFRLNISKAKRLFVSSPSREKTVNWGNPIAELDNESKHGIGLDFGSKEIFFDSQAWLDSDCEDDFYSVHGDFTPSRGNTPNYQIITPQTPYMKFAFSDTKSEPSPTGRKMKLIELLQENSHLQGERVNGKDANKLEKSSEGTPYRSPTHGTDYNQRREKTRTKQHCCMPSFMLSPRRKQKMSPEL